MRKPAASAWPPRSGSFRSPSTPSPPPPTSSPVTSPRSSASWKPPASSWPNRITPPASPNRNRVQTVCRCMSGYNRWIVKSGRARKMSICAPFLIASFEEYPSESGKRLTSGAPPPPQCTNPHCCCPPAKSRYPQTPDRAQKHPRCSPCPVAWADHGTPRPAPSTPDSPS